MKCHTLLIPHGSLTFSEEWKGRWDGEKMEDIGGGERVGTGIAMKNQKILYFKNS